MSGLRNTPNELTDRAGASRDSNEEPVPRRSTRLRDRYDRSITHSTSTRGGDDIERPQYTGPSIPPEVAYSNALQHPAAGASAPLDFMEYDQTGLSGPGTGWTYTHGNPSWDAGYNLLQQPLSSAPPPVPEFSQIVDDGTAQRDNWQAPLPTIGDSDDLFSATYISHSNRGLTPTSSIDPALLITELGSYGGPNYPQQTMNNPWETDASQDTGLPHAFGTNTQAPEFEQGLVAAKMHLQRITWRPSASMEGIPYTDHDISPYVESLNAAFWDLSSVQDQEIYPQACLRFYNRDVWTDRDVYAMATVIVDLARDIHLHGSTSLNFKIPMQIPSPDDSQLTFPERMSWVNHIISQYKQTADAYLRGSAGQVVIVSPLATHNALVRKVEVWTANRDAYMRRQSRLGPTQLMPPPPLPGRST